MAKINKTGKTYLEENEKPVANTSLGMIAPEVDFGKQCLKCKAYTLNFRSFKNGTTICDDCMPKTIPLEMYDEMNGASTSTNIKKTYKN